MTALEAFPDAGYLLLRDECGAEGCQVWFRPHFYNAGEVWGQYDCDHSWISAIGKDLMFTISVICKRCGPRQFRACQFDVDQLILSVDDTEAEWWSYCTEISEAHRIVAVMAVSRADG